MPSSILPQIGAFLDPVAIVIVFGGSVLSTLLRAPLADVRRAVAALGIAGRDDAFDARPQLNLIADLARTAERKGVYQLDRIPVSDPDIAAAVTAIADGAQPHEVEAMVSAQQAARTERHLSAIDIWAGLGELAPAMGMIGTLVGLIRMFMSMTDPQAIGGAMAIALLTTLYGAVLANLVAVPIAARLRRLARIEQAERARLVAPLVALAQSGAVPAFALTPRAQVA